MASEPVELSVRYAKYLCKRNVAGEHHEEYQKCLLRFLETSAGAPQYQRDAERMRHFMKELASDNKPLPQRQHAANAVSLYFQMLKEHGSCLTGGGTVPPTDRVTHPESVAHPLPTAASYDAPPLFSLFRGRIYVEIRFA